MNVEIKFVIVLRQVHIYIHLEMSYIFSSGFYIRIRPFVRPSLPPSVTPQTSNLLLTIVSNPVIFKIN